MGASFTILAAGLLTAQATEAAHSGKTCNCQKGATTTVQAVEQPASNNPIVGRRFRGNSSTINDDRPSIFTRIQNLFKKNDSAVEPPMVQPAVEQPRSGQLMQRMPSGQPMPAPTSVPPAPVKSVQPVTFQATPTVAPATRSVTPPASRPNRISADLVGKIGHETDYSWITGQLHVENGVYVIHYATPEVVDQHNGSLVLAGNADLLRGYQDGDFVSVRGTVAGGNGRAVYRLTGIDRLPR